MGLKLLTVQLLTLLMNVSEPANSANRLDRVSPGQIVDRQHLSCREHTHVAFW